MRNCSGDPREARTQLEVTRRISADSGFKNQLTCKIKESASLTQLRGLSPDALPSLPDDSRICVHGKRDRGNWQFPGNARFISEYRRKISSFLPRRNRTFKLRLMEHLLTETLLVRRIRLKFDAIRLPGDSFLSGPLRRRGA